MKIQMGFKAYNNNPKLSCHDTSCDEGGTINCPKETGLFPTFTVDVTVSVAVSITETVLLPGLATYTLVPSGLTATPVGPLPTLTVAVTVFVVVSTTETVLPYSFATYTFVPSGLTATPQG